MTPGNGLDSRHLGSMNSVFICSCPRRRSWASKHTWSALSVARRVSSSSLSLSCRHCRFVVVVVVFMSSAIDSKHSKPSTKSDLHMPCLPNTCLDISTRSNTNQWPLLVVVVTVVIIVVVLSLICCCGGCRRCCCCLNGNRLRTYKEIYDYQATMLCSYAFFDVRKEEEEERG